MFWGGFFMGVMGIMGAEGGYGNNGGYGETEKRLMGMSTNYKFV